MKEEQEEWDRVLELTDLLNLVTNRIEIKTTEDGWFDRERTIDSLEKGIQKLNGFLERINLMEEKK